MKLVLAVLAVEDVADPPEDWWMIAGVVVVLLVVSVVYLYFDNTCPKCKRRGALKKTGKPATLFNFEKEEVKCKYCGDRHWREEPVEGGA